MYIASNFTKKTHSSYYNKKLTSSINYARSYKLKCLIDKDLQEIYNLEDVEIFNDINDISAAFIRTLEQFYNDKNDNIYQYHYILHYNYKYLYLKIKINIYKKILLKNYLYISLINHAHDYYYLCVKRTRFMNSMIH